MNENLSSAPTRSAGQNIAIKYQYAKGNRDRYPELAADLVRLKVNVIVVSGRGPAVAAKSATTLCHMQIGQCLKCGYRLAGVSVRGMPALRHPKKAAKFW